MQRRDSHSLCLQCSRRRIFTSDSDCAETQVNVFTSLELCWTRHSTIKVKQKKFFNNLAAVIMWHVWNITLALVEQGRAETFFHSFWNCCNCRGQLSSGAKKNPLMSSTSLCWLNKQPRSQWDISQNLVAIWRSRSHVIYGQQYYQLRQEPCWKYHTENTLQQGNRCAATGIELHLRNEINQTVTTTSCNLILKLYVRRQRM